MTFGIPLVWHPPSISVEDMYGSNWREDFKRLIDWSSWLPEAFRLPIQGEYSISSLTFKVDLCKVDFMTSPQLIVKPSNLPPNQVSRTFTQPRIGSIVRYVMCNGVVKPAIVLEVSPTTFVGSNKDLVYLQVFDEPNRYEWARFSPDSPNTWHWSSDE